MNKQKSKNRITTKSLKYWLSYIPPFATRAESESSFRSSPQSKRCSANIQQLNRITPMQKFL